jgi:hypothetical protein
MDEARLVPRESATYREFARLYQLARRLRPTGIDRWNGDLYATGVENWGEFAPKTGDMRLSGTLVLQRLTARPGEVTEYRRAEALATVLHEATHAGMATDAADEPNAVRTAHSQGLMEGFAEVRTVQDFPAFARLAGYPGIELPTPTYAGAYAATENLLQQAAGPAKDRLAFIAEGVHGPAVMHFDQLADGVVRNRLAEVVPFHEDHRRAVRAALVAPMLHRGWPTLKHMAAETGIAVAEDIRRSLNSKVDEIRRHYSAHPHEVFPVDPPNARVGRERVVDRASGAAGAQKAAGGAGSAGPARVGSGSTGAGNSGPGRTERGTADAVGARPEMRFLDGQAGAAGAVRRQPVLGDGARGRGTGDGAGQARGAGPGRGPGHGSGPGQGRGAGRE